MGEIAKKTSHQQRRFVIQALCEKQIEGDSSIYLYFVGRISSGKKITHKFLFREQIPLLEVVWTIVLLEL